MDRPAAQRPVRSRPRSWRRPHRCSRRKRAAARREGRRHRARCRDGAGHRARGRGTARARVDAPGVRPPTRAQRDLTNASSPSSEVCPRGQRARSSSSTLAQTSLPHSCCHAPRATRPWSTGCATVRERCSSAAHRSSRRGCSRRDRGRLRARPRTPHHAVSGITRPLQVQDLRMRIAGSSRRSSSSAIPRGGPSMRQRSGRSRFSQARFEDGMAAFERGRDVLRDAGIAGELELELTAGWASAVVYAPTSRGRRCSSRSPTSSSAP